MQSFQLSPSGGVKDSAHIVQQQHVTACMEHCPPGGAHLSLGVRIFIGVQSYKHG